VGFGEVRRGQEGSGMVRYGKVRYGQAW